MSNDELLAKVELTLVTYISKYYGSKKDVELRSDVIDSLQALRAVVELHKPMRLPDGDVDCSVCENTNSHWSGVPYPCPTIQAITNRLGE